MEIEITEEVENPMLHRTDVTFELYHDEATPSRLSVRDSLAARLNKSADEVVIRRLDTKFGMRKTVGTAKVYETPDDAREIEQTYMLDRNKIGAAENGDGEVGEAGDAAEADSAVEDGPAEPAEEAEAAEAEPEPPEEEPDAEADTADVEGEPGDAEVEAESTGEEAEEPDAEAELEGDDAEAEEEPESEAG